MAIPADIAVPLNLIPFNPIYCLKVLWHLTQELHSGLLKKHSSQPNGLIHCQSNIQGSGYPGRCLHDLCKRSTLSTDSTKKNRRKKEEKLTEVDNLIFLLLVRTARELGLCTALHTEWGVSDICADSHTATALPEINYVLQELGGLLASTYHKMESNH